MFNVKSCSMLAATLLLVACSSTPVAPPVAAKPAPAPAAAPAMAASPAPAPAPSPATASTIATVSLPEYLDPKSSLAGDRSVYFDFDDYSIKTEYQGMVERHGKYLASHPGVAIKIEGNADERGSAEYNLALGQKRAEAVSRALQLLGAKSSQMEAISWGEERPRAQGHDEAAWAQNRRADLVYPSK